MSLKIVQSISVLKHQLSKHNPELEVPFKVIKQTFDVWLSTKY